MVNVDATETTAADRYNLGSERLSQHLNNVNNYEYDIYNLAHMKKYCKFQEYKHTWNQKIVTSYLEDTLGGQFSRHVYAGLLVRKN